LVKALEILKIQTLVTGESSGRALKFLEQVQFDPPHVI
jgi:hypothetical protein